jgi:hypothetical protein
LDCYFFSVALKKEMCHNIVPLDFINFFTENIVCNFIYIKIIYSSLTINKINRLDSNEGRAFSMTRLDQLAKPIRKNGEHMSAIIERERRKAEDMENLTKTGLSQSSPSDKRMSRSMMHLGGKSRDGSRSISSPLQKHHKNAEHTKSMTQLSKSPSKAGWIQKNYLPNKQTLLRLVLKRLLEMAKPAGKCDQK